MESQGKPPIDNCAETRCLVVGCESKFGVYHIRSDTGAYGLYVDASPRICAQMYQSMLARGMLQWNRIQSPTYLYVDTKGQ